MKIANKRLKPGNFNKTPTLVNLECAIWADEQKQRDLQKSREICINHK